MEQITAALEAVGSARVSTVYRFKDFSGREIEVCDSGVADFVGHRMLTRREDTGQEHLIVGSDVLHRLSEEQRQEVGKTWLREGPYCSCWENERAEIAPLYEHLHHHGVRKTTFEIWLGEDGRLLLMREHCALLWSAQGLGRPIAWSTDPWDFGVEPEIVVPPSSEVLHPSSDTDELYLKAVLSDVPGAR